MPAVNHVELHPYFSQPEVQQATARHQILPRRGCRSAASLFYPGWSDGRRNVLRDETVTAIAEQHGKTSAQVLLRWHLQQGRPAIPKSTNRDRIRQNIDVLDFELSAEQVNPLDALGTG